MDNYKLEKELMRYKSDISEKMDEMSNMDEYVKSEQMDKQRIGEALASKIEENNKLKKEIDKIKIVLIVQ